MKWMSAAVYGQRALSARAFAFAASAPVRLVCALPAHATTTAVTAIADRTVKNLVRLRFTAGLERETSALENTERARLSTAPATQRLATTSLQHATCASARPCRTRLTSSSSVPVPQASRRRANWPGGAYALSSSRRATASVDASIL